MSKLAFTLIELILVVVLIGLISFLVLRFPSFILNKKVSIVNLRELLYPNGKFYLLNDGSEIIIKKKKKEFNIRFEAPIIYIYNGNFFEKKSFGYLKNKKIVFKYCVKNGIGESFILQNGNKFYVFKPFLIKEFNSLKEAENFFLLRNFQPKIGAYY